MVVAVASSSPPASEAPVEKKMESNYGGLPPSEKVKVARKTRTMEITSRYKTSTTTGTTGTAMVTGATTTTTPGAVSRRNPSPIRHSSPSRQPSPVRNRTTENHVRHPSPNLGRSNSTPEVAKRAYSAERRRPWPGAETARSTSEALPKARPQSRTSELWPSMKPSSAESKRESNASEGNHQTLKSAENGVHRAVVDSSGRKASPMRRQSVDQSENARPPENSKPEQQRWPGMSTGKVFTSSLARSVDLSVEKDRRPSTVQSRPGTPSSRTKGLVSRTSSYSRIGNEAPPRRNPTPTRGRAIVEPARNGHGNGDGDGAHVRRLSQDSVATVDSLSTPLDIMSDTESVSSAGSAQGNRVVRGTTVPARVWQDMNNRLRRFSEGDRNRTSDASDLPVVAIAPVRTVRRSKVLPHQSAASMLMNQSMNQSMNGSTTSAWALSPGRHSGNSAQSTPSSPSHSKGTSPLRGLPSPQRSRPVHGTAAALAGTSRNLGNNTVNFGIDGRARGKRALTQQEEAQLLRILHNRWLQWRFVNARAEAVMSAQKAAAERQLYYVWIKTSELRTSVAMQRIKLQQARQAHKLRSILSTHAIYLENWETLEEEHSNALTGCMEALESAILRVPVTGGARADVQAVKEALNSAVDVLNAVEGSVQFLLPKTQSMESLLSQLAETAAQERALLEECGDLLSVAASLEVEERSLRTHLIQLENERKRLFVAEPVNTLNTSSHLSTP